MRVPSLVVVLVFLSLSSACGLGGGNYSCDFRPKSPQCTDWRDLIGPAVTQQALCKTLNASAGEGAWTANMKCPATDSVGGCQTNTGAGKQTNWFYAPRTEADVKSECASDGTTFVTP
ncbi:MAG: hypothetical protein U0228_08090 [Myxococcaceae bacterium]